MSTPPVAAPEPSPLDAATAAYEHTRRHLFPFKFERWLALGLVAFLEQCGRGGMGFGGPNLNVVNLNLTKSFRFRERYAVELRGEAFNLMNTVSFNPPSAQFGSPNFGRVTSAAPARVVQYAVRLQF